MPEANLLLVAFPNDREMRLLTEADLKRWLADHATTLANAGGRYPRWRLKALTVRLLRYAPGERLTTGCRGVFESEDGVQQPFAYIAKQLGKKRRARPLYRNLRSLGHHLSGSPTVRLPRAIAVDDETGLVMMEELPGKELKRSLHEVDVDAVMRALGEMLATFHQVPRRVRQTISVQNELHDVNRAASAIRSVVPSVASRVDACVARCRAMRWTDGTPNVLLHGACRLKHVFIHDGRLALVDVDGIRMGHPGYRPWPLPVFSVLPRSARGNYPGGPRDVRAACPRGVRRSSTLAGVTRIGALVRRSSADPQTGAEVCVAPARRSPGKDRPRAHPGRNSSGRV